MSARNKTVRRLDPTPWCTVGPYFSVTVTEEKCVGCIAPPGVTGERLKLICAVFDRDGNAVPDTMIEIWQANAAGKYNHPADRQAKPVEPGFRGFGRQITDAAGTCEFETIKPGRVPGARRALRGEPMQAPHLEVGVFTRGVLRLLATRIYFADDPANAECPVLALVPKARRSTLMAQPVEGQAGGWRHEIHLSGPKETVFFDV